MVSAAFCALTFIAYHFNQKSTEIHAHQQQLSEHRLEIAKLRNELYAIIHQTKAGDSLLSSSPLPRDIVKSSKWLEIMTILNQPLSETNPILFDLVKRAHSDKIDTHQFKLQHNEIRLALTELTQDHGSPPATDLIAAQAQYALTLVTNYQEHINPVIQRRLEKERDLEQRLTDLKSSALIAMALIFAGLFILILTNFIQLVRWRAHGRRQNRLLSQCLTQSHSGLMVLNRELEVEYADIDHLGFKGTQLFTDPAPLEAILYNHLDEQELFSWKLALQKLFLSDCGFSLTNKKLTKSFQFQLGDEVKEFTLTSCCSKILGSPRILTTWIPTTIPTTSHPDTETEIQPDNYEPAKAPQSEPQLPSPTKNHIRLKKDFSRRLKLIETLTKMDQSIATEFFKDTKKSFQTSQTRVNALQKGLHNPSTMLSGLLQQLHQIKGDSAILGLTALSQKIHQLESELNDLPHPPTSDPDKLTKIAEHFELIKRQFEGIYRLFFRFNSKEDQLEESERQNFTTYLNQYAQKIARDAKKHIKLIEDNLSTVNVPDENLSQLITLMSQLVRNAIVHGIEDTDTRLKLQKTPYGCVHIGVHQNENFLTIRVRDDGRGIEIPKVLNKAKHMGKYDPEQSKRLSSQALFKLLATPGLTTQSQADEHAGRGIGLELVNNVVHSLKGKIRLVTKPGQYTEFVINIPKQTANSTGDEEIPTLFLESKELVT